MEDVIAQDALENVLREIDAQSSNRVDVGLERALGLKDQAADRVTNVLTIEWGKRVVAFIDLLGTKALMSRTAEDPESTYNIFSQISSKFTGLAKMMEREVGKVLHTVISDSYVISVPVEGDAIVRLFKVIAEFQRYCLIEHGELSRGGVAVGDMIEGRKEIIGKAFVDAHLLEVRSATYPRVVVQKSLMNDSKFKAVYKQLPLAVDKDGLAYVSYIDADKSSDCCRISAIVDGAIPKFNQDTELDKIQKWAWVKTYLLQTEKCKVNCCY